jgi:hypothetical protein
MCDHSGSREEQLLARGIGQVLRVIHQQWRLSLREVEERSLRFARDLVVIHDR